MDIFYHYLITLHSPQKNNNNNKKKSCSYKNKYENSDKV